MLGALILLLMAVCYTAGWVHADATRWIRDHRALPAATPRAIARARRRNRADLRHVWPAREAGVRLVRPPLGEPTSFDPFREETDGASLTPNERYADAIADRVAAQLLGGRDAG